MSTKKHVRQRDKTALAVLRKMLTYGEKTKVVRLTRAEARALEKRGEPVKWAKDLGSAYGEKKVPAPLQAETVAGWLGCGVFNYRAIESNKAGRTLSTDQAQVIAYQTAVHLRWLLENDPAKPLVSRRGQPYSQADFNQRQADIKSGKGNFVHPLTLRDVSRQREKLAGWFGMATAILLRALERGEADVFDYKVRRALKKIYGEPLPGENQHDWNDLTMQAQFHGNPTLTRPDVGPLLDTWESRFKAIASRRSDGKAPLQFPKQTRSLPTPSPTAKRATRKAKRKRSRC